MKDDAPIRANEKPLTRCRKCGCWVRPAYGEDSPAEHSDHSGSKTEPRAPGDYDDICDRCGYHA